MNNLLFAFVSVYCFFSFNMYAQNDCSEEEFENQLQVTKLDFNNERDTIVTIKNNCDTCSKRAYTVVIVYTGSFNAGGYDDTLAIDVLFSGEVVPENNGKRTYTAVVKKEFKLTQEFKIGLFRAC